MEALNLNLLEEFEIEEYEQKQEEFQQRFRISDLNQASWAFRKMSAYEKKQEEIEEVANLEMIRIKEWKEKETIALKKSISFFEGLLANYLYELRSIDPKAKVTTPYGTVGSRKQKPQWNVDNVELMEWLKSNDRTDLIRVKEEPALSNIQSEFNIIGDCVVDGNGEIVSGIKIIDQEDKIIVKVK